MSKNGLLIGRWQTLHEGHDWLIEQVRDMGLFPLLAIRDTARSMQNPLTAQDRQTRIRERYCNSVQTIIIPDIAGVYYGRDVGYEVRELIPPERIAQISGSRIREAHKRQVTAGE